MTPVSREQTKAHYVHSTTLRHTGLAGGEGVATFSELCPGSAESPLNSAIS